MVLEFIIARFVWLILPPTIEMLKMFSP